MPNAEVSAIVRSRRLPAPLACILCPGDSSVSRHGTPRRQAAARPGRRHRRYGSMLKDQARRRAVSEHAVILVGQLSFCGTYSAAAGDELAFSLILPGPWG